MKKVNQSKVISEQSFIGISFLLTYFHSSIIFSAVIVQLEFFINLFGFWFTFFFDNYKLLEF